MPCWAADSAFSSLALALTRSISLSLAPSLLLARSLLLSLSFCLLLARSLLLSLSLLLARSRSRSLSYSPARSCSRSLSYSLARSRSLSYSPARSRSLFLFLSTRKDGSAKCEFLCTLMRDAEMKLDSLEPCLDAFVIRKGMKGEREGFSGKDSF